MTDLELRRHLVELLTKSGAHVGLEAALRGLPATLRGTRPAGHAHSAWQLLEHLRIAQWDILEFSRDPEHESPAWPQGYWPGTEAPPDEAAWESSVEAFRRDLAAMCELIESAETDLLAPLPWGSGQTLLREALVLADHNAYHAGQIVTLRRALGAWTR